MPQIVFTMDEIMDREKRDMYFVRFGEVFSFAEGEPAVLAAQTIQLAWFDAHNLKYEMTAPRGWFLGNTGIYAVFFDGEDDPRIAEYTTMFEIPTGTSLDPENYQMIFVPYQIWLKDEYPSWAASKNFKH